MIFFVVWSKRVSMDLNQQFYYLMNAIKTRWFDLMNWFSSVVASTGDIDSLKQTNKQKKAHSKAEICSPVAQTSMRRWVSFPQVLSRYRPRTTENAALGCTATQSGTGCSNVGRSGSQSDLWEATTCRRSAGTAWNLLHQLHQDARVPPRSGRARPGCTNATCWHWTAEKCSRGGTARAWFLLQDHVTESRSSLSSELNRSQSGGDASVSTPPWSTSELRSCVCSVHPHSTRPRFSWSFPGFFNCDKPSDGHNHKHNSPNKKMSILTSC